MEIRTHSTIFIFFTVLVALCSAFPAEIESQDQSHRLTARASLQTSSRNHSLFAFDTSTAAGIAEAASHISARSLALLFDPIWGPFTLAVRNNDPQQAVRALNNAYLNRLDNASSLISDQDITLNSTRLGDPPDPVSVTKGALAVVFRNYTLGGARPTKISKDTAGVVQFQLSAGLVEAMLHSGRSFDSRYPGLDFQDVLTADEGERVIWRLSLLQYVTYGQLCEFFKFYSRWAGSWSGSDDAQIVPSCEFNLFHSGAGPLRERFMGSGISINVPH